MPVGDNEVYRHIVAVGLDFIFVKELKIVQDHEQILEALRTRDAGQAEALMQKHLSRYKFDATAIREKFPQYFH